MDAYHRAHHLHNRTSHLTRLYSDVKKSADTKNLDAYRPATEQIAGLQRKYRIQRDRLITWGLAWSDDEKGVDGNIDDSVARAGLTETVDSVLRNIKEVTDEAERMRLGGLLSTSATGDDKLPLLPTSTSINFDEARYEDLLQDLTASIDTLYDLSRSRKALARGEHPSFTAPAPEKPSLGDDVDTDKNVPIGPFDVKSSTHGYDYRKRPASPVASERTLVNPPPFMRPVLSPYAGLPPRIDISALRLSSERPPPYESLGLPSTNRMVGRLIRARVSESVQNAIGSSADEVAVLVEYADYDSIYRDTHVPPPLQRLEALASYLQPMRQESQSNFSILGYFEDADQPRVGLVYDLPYTLQNKIKASAERSERQLIPVSLHDMVRRSRKSQGSGEDLAAPALEARFQLALRLTEHLQDMHMRDMYHGNVNSSSVILPTVGRERPLTHAQMRTPLWASFDVFSKCNVEGISRDINLNIYRHPADSPYAVDRDFDTDVKYDVYGLALVLLEIGLWIPIGELYKAKYTIADFKLRIERMWIPRLAAKCGSTYMRVVQACLRVADEPAGIQVSPHAVYDVLVERLRRCCLVDEDDSATDLLSTLAYRNASDHSLPDIKDPSRMRFDEMESSRTASRTSSIAPMPTRHEAPTQPAREAPAEPTGRTRLTRHFTTPPSLKDYKHRITLIQRKWREHWALRKHQMTQTVNTTRSTNEATLDTDGTSKDALRSRRKEFPAVKLPQSLLDDWHNKIALQLANLIERALKDSPESSSIALTAYGETAETARPTLLICCKSTAQVKQVLKRHFKYDHALYDLRVKKDEIRRCRKSRRDVPPSLARRSMACVDRAIDRASNPDYQERPLCGASIGAYRNEEHLPPVSFGGVVMVDGTPYGMSVHHMLEFDDDGDGPTETGEDDDGDDDSDTSSLVSFDESSSVLSHSDDEDTVRPPSTLPDLPERDDSHDGDMPGIMPDDYEEIPITQPALDDAIDMNLHVDEDDNDDNDNEDDDDIDSGIDEDHLLSYKLGQVHASSGLKRSPRPQSMHQGFHSISQSLPQEIDWALFELIPPRVHPFNVIRGGTRYWTSGRRGNARDSCPVAVRDSAQLACAPVHCLGRTSGLQARVISRTMELLKIHGRSTFSASWTVDGSFGVGGDSGAWIVSNDDGTVCGHVLACRRGKTYICPMDLLLRDIRETLGARDVSLPPVVAPKTTASLNAPASSLLSTRADALVVGVERLEVGREGEGVGGGGVTLPVSPPASPKRRAATAPRDRFPGAGSRTVEACN